MNTRPMSDLLSLKGYARHRGEAGLTGATISAVFRAVREGRITRSCAAHDRCPMGCSVGKIDAIRADAEWSHNSETGRPGYTREMREARSAGRDLPATPAEAEEEAEEADATEPGKNTAADGRRVYAIWKGRQAELDYRKSAGEIVLRDEAWREIFKRARGLRDSLLEIPRRLAPNLASLSDVREIEEIIAAELRRILEDMKGLGE